MITIGHERPCKNAGPLALRLRLVRFVYGLQVREMAAELGFSRETLQKYEMGEHVPMKKRAREIAATLGVPADWLMGEGPVFSWGDIPEPMDPAELEPQPDDDTPYLLDRDSDPGKMLRDAKYSDFELETLMKEQKALKQMASYVDGAVTTTEEEREHVKATMQKLARAYAAECERIDMVLDIRERANALIDSLEDSYHRDIMRRHFLQRQTVDEIADELGTPRGRTMPILINELISQLRLRAGTQDRG